MSIRYFFPAVFLLFAFTCFADDFIGYEYKPDEILVRFASKETGPQRSVTEKAQILQSENCGKIKRSYKIVPGLTHVKLPKGLSVQEALKRLNKRKDIISARPNYKIYLLSTFPNDMYLPNQWSLHNMGQRYPAEDGGESYGTEDADIDAPEAWDIHTGSQNMILAVLDTGIDYAHPDLAANMWVNQAELIGDPTVTMMATAIKMTSMAMILQMVIAIPTIICIMGLMWQVRLVQSSIMVLVWLVYAGISG